MHLLIKPNQVYLATIWKMSEFKDLWINMISKKNFFFNNSKCNISYKGAPIWLIKKNQFSLRKCK